MSAWKYKSLMPEIIVAKLRLIEPKDMIDLAGRSLNSIRSMLINTPYQKEISDIPPRQLSSFSLEKAFLRNYVKTCKGIVDHSPRDTHFLLSSILTKFEADSVKAILRAKEARISVDEAMRFIIPVGRLDEVRCQKILESAKNVGDVVGLLSDLEYGSVLKEALRGREETRVLLPLAVALDKYVYGNIWKTTGKLGGLDKRIAKTVLGVEIDSINIKIILRCRTMGISQDQMKRYLIPVTEVFGEKELEEAIKMADIKSFIESLLTVAKLSMIRDYQYILTDLLKEYESSRSLSRLEMILDRGLLKTSLRMLKRYTPFFNIGLILAFLHLKWFELKNLRVIMRGVESKIAPDKIRELLVLPG